MTPSIPSPRIHREPPVLRANVCTGLVDAERQFEAFSTRTQLIASAREPIPNWPNLPLPQDQSVPFFLIPKEKYPGNC